MQISCNGEKDESGIIRIRICKIEYHASCPFGASGERLTSEVSIANYGIMLCNRGYEQPRLAYLYTYHLGSGRVNVASNEAVRVRLLKLSSPVIVMMRRERHCQL